MRGSPHSHHFPSGPSAQHTHSPWGLNYLAKQSAQLCKLESFESDLANLVGGKVLKGNRNFRAIIDSSLIVGVSSASIGSFSSPLTTPVKTYQI